MTWIGTILDNRYELLERIGTGGMANVFKARCVGTDYYVAVKILKREYNEDEAFLRKFIAEARSTEGLDHPNIVKNFDAGKDHGLYYIVMELADGMTLKQYIKRYGRLSARETVDFSLQIAAAIQAAHDHGIIHRDIKPQNILVSDSGIVKVTDFGIAKAATSDTTSSNAMGSVRYFSPEQARGGYSDRRSDIYSLGITMYEMATGRLPFDGDNSVAIALMHLREDATPPRDYFPDIPKSLENIILKCVRKKPEERYQTAGDLISDLSRVFDSPDGNYVRVESLVDDSPTRARTPDEVKAVRQSMDQSANRNQAGGYRADKPVQDGPVRIRETEEDLEDAEDDDRSGTRFEKMILIIAIMLGVAFAGFLIFAIGSSLHLFHSPFGTEEASTDTAEPSTASATEEEYVSVPDFMQLNREKALERAEKHSLNVEFTEEEYPADYDPDQLIVTAQNPVRGTEVVEGTVISLTLGPDEELLSRQVEVPDLKDMEESEAVKTVEGAGLVASIIYSSSESVKQGYVIKQNPSGGTKVDRGFTVTITVSRGLGQVKVPSLTGESQKSAEKMLNDVGLVLGDISNDYSGSVGVGDVISQDIAAGSLVEKGTAVSVTISLGEEESYHYEGVVSLLDPPFASDESGSVEIVVKQGDREAVIYSGDDLSESDFPLNVDYTSEDGDEAVAYVYVNGEEYDSFPVELSAVAD